MELRSEEIGRGAVEVVEDVCAEDEREGGGKTMDLVEEEDIEDPTVDIVEETDDMDEEIGGEGGREEGVEMVVTGKEEDVGAEEGTVVAVE